MFLRDSPATLSIVSFSFSRYRKKTSEVLSSRAPFPITNDSDRPLRRWGLALRLSLQKKASWVSSSLRINRSSNIVIFFALAIWMTESRMIPGRIDVRGVVFRFPVGPYLRQSLHHRPVPLESIQSHTVSFLSLLQTACQKSLPSCTKTYGFVTLDATFSQSRWLHGYEE